MSVAVVLFTRDLRVHDNPVLAAACAHADQVVPLFVRDRQIDTESKARIEFLDDCLADLDASLRRIGGHLVVRTGDVVAETCRLAREVGADQVHVAADHSRYARSRHRRLADALAGERRRLRRHDAVHTVHAPGSLLPTGNDHFAVFTPYWRRWQQAQRRPVLRAPRRLEVPLPAGKPVRSAGQGAGETAARKRLTNWLRTGIGHYADRHDDLAADATSRLSPYLHLGALSANEIADRAEGNDEFVRQLAWRDFHHQVLAARPGVVREDYRTRHDTWRGDEDELAAWREGMTGFPIVDAGMRQLLAESWMHNRARLITGSFLTKTLHHDWRAGAAHFFARLVDGDIANNVLNWQWVAGTGTDTRPNRVLNPMRQADRYDPTGDYVRRWVPELADLPTELIHQPWRAAEADRNGYPDRIVDLDDARTRFLADRRS